MKAGFFISDVFPAFRLDEWIISTPIRQTNTPAAPY